MQLPDLLITWIKHADYPVFRAFLQRNRGYFGKVIIYFSEHNRFPYFDHFIQDALKDDRCIFLDTVETDWGREDWRNKSTNEMLKYSSSEWVCSIEQDFFTRDFPMVYHAIAKAAQTADLVGWQNEAGKYIHPSCWFIKRDVLEKTRKDFAAHDQYDHFGWITYDVEQMNGKIARLQDLGLTDFKDFFHLGGVNQNYLEGLKEGYVFHRPEIFYVYNYFCRRQPVPMDERFVKISHRIDEVLAPMFPGVDPLQSKWGAFFIV